MKESLKQSNEFDKLTGCVPVTTHDSSGNASEAARKAHSGDDNKNSDFC